MASPACSASRRRPFLRSCIPRSGRLTASADKIGAWPIFALTDNELVTGRDNKHLDFRISVLKRGEGAVFSTVCIVNNTFGKLYLLCIVPFHTWGIRKLISNAVVARRL